MMGVPRRESRRAELSLIVTLLPVLLLAGCGQQQGTFLGGKRTSQIETVSKEQLREKLVGFKRSTESLLRETSLTLRELDPEIGTRRSDVVRNLRFAQAMQAVLDQEEPIIAFLETWGLTMRLTDYFRAGYGSALFGEHQGIAVKAAERLETDLERIGSEILSEAEFEETRTEMRSFARRNPINEAFSNLQVYVTEARPGEPSPFQNVLSIPLSPFTALRGIDRTAGAIYSVKESVNRTADVVETLPESARWQLLLLLADMEDSELGKTLRASASTLSNSSVRYADIAEKYPERVREQASILVKELDDGQANVQQTLEKTQETAGALDHTLGEARATLGEVGKTAAAVGAMAEQLQAVATATTDLLASVKPPGGAEPNAPPKAGATVQDYRGAITDATKATSELQALIAEVRALMESEVWTVRIEDVHNRTEKVIDRSAVETKGVADHVVWRLMQLAGVIALLVLAVRLASARISHASIP